MMGKMVQLGIAIRVRFSDGCRKSESRAAKEVRHAHADRLIERAADTDGDTTVDEVQRFVYDQFIKGGLDDVVLVFDSGDNLTERLLHGPAVDQVFASEDDLGEILWHLGDNQNTIRDVADYDAALDETTIVNHRTFDSFGELISESGTTAALPLAFQGRYRDPLTGLQNHRARWYDAFALRWTSADPIGFAAGDTNLQRMVANSPTIYIDPSGLFEIEWKGEFTQAQQQQIFDAIPQIEANLPTLIADVEEEFENLPEDLQDQLEFEVQNYQAVLESVLEGLQSDTNLEIHSVNDAEWDALASMWNGWCFLFVCHDSELTLTHAHDWDDLSEDELTTLLFHELTHLYGTEDDDTAGTLMNAHTIDNMIITGLDGSPIWTYLQNHPEATAQPWVVPEALAHPIEPQGPYPWFPAGAY